MRVVLVAIVIACLTFAPALASQAVTPEDAQAMQLEAVADSAPDRIHGRFEFLQEDPEAAVDQTNGRGSDNPYDDCAHTPIRAKRSDGSTVTKFINVCD
jgi:hypothetical protein